MILLFKEIELNLLYQWLHGFFVCLDGDDAKSKDLLNLLSLDMTYGNIEICQPVNFDSRYGLGLEYFDILCGTILNI